MDKEKKEIDPTDLPQSEVFKRKEVYQHPQPADMGKPLDTEHDASFVEDGKEQNKTSKEEGLNEERSPGTGGAFEGFENEGMHHDR